MALHRDPLENKQLKDPGLVPNALRVRLVHSGSFTLRT